jgi:hypothetical protein
MSRIHRLLAALLCSLLCGACHHEIAGPPVQTQNPPRAVTGWVAYTQYDSTIQTVVIWKARLDGTGARSLHIVGTYPRWNPRGSQVLYYWDRYYVDIAAIWLADSSGQNQHAFWETHGTLAEWNPSGTAVMVDGRPVTLSGTCPLVACNPTQFFAGESLHVRSGGYAQWYVDDTHVVAAGYPELPDYTDCTQHYDWYVLNAGTGRVESRLTSAGYRSCLDLLEQVSPDGRYALTLDIAADGSRRVMVLDIVKGTSRFLTAGPHDDYARWGSDSRTVVFLRADPTVREACWIMRTELDQPGMEVKVLDHTVWPEGLDIHLD